MGSKYSLKLLFIYLSTAKNVLTTKERKCLNTMNDMTVERNNLVPRVSDERPWERGWERKTCNWLKKKRIFDWHYPQEAHGRILW